MAQGPLARRSWSRVDPRLFRLPRRCTGSYGLLAWIDTSRDLEAARAGAGAAQTRARAAAARTSQAFQRDSIDRDLLEEELRKLGYVKPNEVIILRRDEPTAQTPG